MPSTTSRKPRTLEVFVYRNLHLKGVTWSVRQVSTGRVLFHTTSVILKHARFVVNLAGRDKVRREGKKNVHAGVQGELVTDVDCIVKMFDKLCGSAEVYYNPYTCNTFVSKEHRDIPITFGDFVLLSSADEKSRVTFMNW